MAGAALATVAIATGKISYGHIDWLTLTLGGGPSAGKLMPFAVDGQIVVGSVVLLTAKGRHAYWGWLGIVPGLAESLFANYESGIGHGPLAAAWYTVPAEAFAASSFMFERWLKSLVATPRQDQPPGRNETADVSDGDGEVKPKPCPHRITGPAEKALVQAYLHSRDCTGPELSQRSLSATFGVHRDKVAKLVAPHLPPAPEPEPEPAPNGSAPDA